MLVRMGLQLQTERHVSLGRHWGVDPCNKMPTQLLVRQRSSHAAQLHPSAGDSGERECAALTLAECDAPAVVLVVVTVETGAEPKWESQLRITLGT